MQNLLEAGFAASSISLCPDLGGHATDSPTFDVALASILSGETPLALHYQPIIDLKRGVLAGYEALARFPRSMGRSPDFVFLAAKAIGKKHELELAAVHTAVLNKALLPANTFLSINVSPGFLLSPIWDSFVSSHPVLSGLVIEITEEESIQDYRPILHKLHRIRDLGGSIAVDDAGAGYASLQHVIEMKPSFIKIDRKLIKNCHSESAKSVLIEMMGHAADRLDAWIIAEGVETTHELGELIRLSVPLGQGYYLGSPHSMMQPLADPLAARIQSSNNTQTCHNKLAPYVEPCPVRPSRDMAIQVLSSNVASATVVMVTDRWNRPVHMLHRHPLVGARCLPSFMKMHFTTEPVEGLQRALARPMSTRFDPVAVIDGQGALQGVVRIDRLMRGVIGPPASVTDLEYSREYDLH